MKITGKIENSCAFGAMRQGMILLIPLLVIGYGALMIISLPIAGYQEFIQHIWDGRMMQILQFVYQSVNDIFAVLLAVTTSISYALLKSRKKRGYAEPGDAAILAVVTLAALAGYTGIQYEDFSLAAFGNMNTFTALFVSFFTGVLYFRIKDSRLFSMKRRGTNAESSYLDAMNSIGPACLILIIFAVFYQLLHMLCGVNGLQELLEIGVNHLIGSLNNNFLAGIFIVIETHALWFFGIHGHNVLDSVIKQNFSDVSAGIFSKSFQDVFVLMGGAGVMLCLVLAILLFSKAKSLRNIAGMSAPAAVFNISEIAMFGIPVILNPIFVIPFIMVPLLNFLIAYAAVYLGLVPHVISSVEWTTPVLLSGYWATGSWKGAVLQLVCIVIGIFIYRPFVKIFEKQRQQQMIQNVKNLVTEYQKQEENGLIFSLMKREDLCGRTARMLAEELREAILGRTLFLMYQPQVDKCGRISGAEALIRWNHPVYGNIYPPLIIQLAKEMNVMHELDAAILDEAAAARAKLQDYVDEDFDISVNLTNSSLQWDGLVEAVEDSVKKHGIQCKQFCLEITEQDAISSTEDVVHKIETLKSHGHRFLIDDFGMGHTSLLYLQTGFFDVVKLDGSLTRTVLGNETNAEIIASITKLGESLHFTTIAEWVETEEQLERLKELGCDVFQGAFYSRALGFEDLISWLRTYK